MECSLSSLKQAGIQTLQAFIFKKIFNKNIHKEYYAL